MIWLTFINRRLWRVHVYANASVYDTVYFFQALYKFWLEEKNKMKTKESMWL